MSVKKYLTLNGLTYFLNKIKTYLTSSTYLDSIGISNSDIDDIADDAGYSSGSLPASEDIFITGDIIPNTDNTVDLGASSKNIKMVYTKGITINGTQFLPSDYIPKTGSNQISGDLIPSTDGTVNLGSPSYQWNNAYIKSLTINGVACGNILTHNVSEFVDVSSNQTIGGIKTFSNIIYGLGSQIILRRNDVERTVLPASIVYTAFSFNDKSGIGTNSRFSAVENVVKTNGDINLDLRAYDFSTKSNTHTTVVLERKYDGTSSFYPEQNNTVNLGTSTNKWKSLNGINPGALSLPGITYINLDTTNFDVTATTIGTFTPTVDGWAILSMSQKNKHFGIWMISGAYRATFHSVYHQGDYMIFALIPVRANVSMNIYCTADDIDSTRKVDWLRLFPCQGNV